MKPAPYIRADLNWMDKKTRSSVEMNDKSSRPSLADKDAKNENDEKEGKLQIHSHLTLMAQSLVPC